jgi:hypothetical protein
MAPPHWTEYEKKYFLEQVVPYSDCASGICIKGNGQPWADLANKMAKHMDTNNQRPKKRAYNGDALYQYWRRVYRANVQKGLIDTSRKKSLSGTPTSNSLPQENNKLQGRASPESANSSLFVPLASPHPTSIQQSPGSHQSTLRWRRQDRNMNTDGSTDQDVDDDDDMQDDSPRLPLARRLFQNSSIEPTGVDCVEHRHNLAPPGLENASTFSYLNEVDNTYPNAVGDQDSNINGFSRVNRLTREIGSRPSGLSEASRLKASPRIINRSPETAKRELDQLMQRLNDVDNEYLQSRQVYHQTMGRGNKYTGPSRKKFLDSDDDESLDGMQASSVPWKTKKAKLPDNGISQQKKKERIKQMLEEDERDNPHLYSKAVHRFAAPPPFNSHLFNISQRDNNSQSAQPGGSGGVPHAQSFGGHSRADSVSGFQPNSVPPGNAGGVLQGPQTIVSEKHRIPGYTIPKRSYQRQDMGGSQGSSSGYQAPTASEKRSFGNERDTENEGSKRRKISSDGMGGKIELKGCPDIQPAENDDDLSSPDLD